MNHTIIVPCYNEADRLEFSRYAAFLDSNTNYSICFVNDGSADATLKQLLEFRQLHENQVFVVNLLNNQGKAEAVRSGIQYMLDTEVDTVGYLDADLATDFDDYLRLVDNLQRKNLSMVFGSRKMDSSNQIKRKASREFASSMIGMVTQKIIGMPIKDTQCGAKVFSRMVAKNLFHASFYSRWLFDVELFIRIKNLFGKETTSHIEEIALNKWEDVEGSKITLRDSIKFPLQLLEIGIKYRVKPQLESMALTRHTSYSPTGVRAYNNAA